jgi:hypothetical protein
LRDVIDGLGIQRMQGPQQRHGERKIEGSFTQFPIDAVR